jgi:hypothetical protein
VGLSDSLAGARERVKRHRDPDSYSPSLADYARGALARAGYELQRVPRPGELSRTHPDIEQDFAAVFGLAQPFTMTSVERMYALWQSVRHVVETDVRGDVVECGVWRGGSSLIAARALMSLGETARTVWLYDTFEGMSAPTERDVSATGEEIVPQWDSLRHDRANPLLCYADLDDVKATMSRSEYPGERIRYVEGKVEETIPADAPETIAVLRLDTDWYESTRHELEHLYPRLSPGGILVLDDYGAWQGARQAVDEYFADHPAPPLLQRIDATGRLAVKPLA